MAKKAQEINLTWSKRLQKLRRKTGKSQRECAGLLPCDVRTWERWEAGKVPPEKNLSGIARVLGVTMEELLGAVPSIVTEAAPPAPASKSVSVLQQISTVIYNTHPTEVPNIGKTQQHLEDYVALLVRDVERQKLDAATKKRPSRAVPKNDEGAETSGNPQE